MTLNEEESTREKRREAFLRKVDRLIRQRFAQDDIQQGYLVIALGNAKVVHGRTLMRELLEGMTYNAESNPKFSVSVTRFDGVTI